LPIQTTKRGEALMLELQGLVVPMRDGAPASIAGAVWIDDHGLIAAVTPLDAEPAGFAGASRVRPVG
jgi:5-methylthioadenosine/S-adenosylhomocysteine deaminase